MNAIHRVATALGLALGMLGCSSTEPQTIETVRFADELGIDLAKMTKLPTGVYIQTVTPGTGAALVVSDRWSVTYKGWLSNGEVFDPGEQPLKDYSFPQVILGFEAMVGMTVGETRKLVIPPNLGYGNADHGSIPGGSVLVFEVKLTAINP